MTSGKSTDKIHLYSKRSYLRVCTQIRRHPARKAASKGEVHHVESSLFFTLACPSCVLKITISVRQILVFWLLVICKQGWSTSQCRLFFTPACPTIYILITRSARQILGCFLVVFSGLYVHLQARVKYIVQSSLLFTPACITWLQLQLCFTVVWWCFWLLVAVLYADFKHA